MPRSKTIVALLAMALTACGERDNSDTSAQEAAPGGSESAAASAPALAGPPASFAQCRSCHAVEPGKNGIGPSLAGVFGRKAASVPGFAYSAALKNSGLTWDEATLDPWLAAPARLVPGTRMVIGVPDPARRAELITYMKTLN